MERRSRNGEVLRYLAGAGFAAFMTLLSPVQASADLTRGVDDVTARTSTHSTTKGSLVERNDSLTVGSYRSGEALASQRAAAQAAELEFTRQVAAYTAALDRWRTCLGQNQGSTGMASSCTEPGSPPARATLPAMLGTTPASLGAAQVRLTPQQVAYVAFARLHLEPLKPVIGPPPELNRWKMAAVALWLSAGGDANPPAVFDEVYNLE